MDAGTASPAEDGFAALDELAPRRGGGSRTAHKPLSLFSVDHFRAYADLMVFDDGERLGRGRRRQEAPPMPEGWYPHEPGDPFYELDWVFLHEHPADVSRTLSRTEAARQLVSRRAAGGHVDRRNRARFSGGRLWPRCASRALTITRPTPEAMFAAPSTARLR